MTTIHDMQESGEADAAAADARTHANATAPGSISGGYLGDPPSTAGITGVPHAGFGTTVPRTRYPMSRQLEADLDCRFTHHPPQGDQVRRYQALRQQAHDLAEAIVQDTPPSREQSLALTKLEECIMWANSAIARHE